MSPARPTTCSPTIGCAGSREARRGRSPWRRASRRVARGAGAVVVHPGARPVVHPDDVRRCVAALADHDGAVLGRPVADTLKLATEGEIQGTVDRAYLFRAETPQAFPRALFEKALAAAAVDRFVGTDEASLVERLPGVRLASVEAEHPNPKLTTRADLTLVAALLRYDPAP
ncbi:MAG: 2-C-methyl-D-erythritol 4-phosphate cytidylyltransferase [Thermoanaerobaculia bacterium]